MRVLVIDIGGSNVKFMLSGQEQRIKVKSGPNLTPQRLVELTLEQCADWHYDAISIGFPSPVRENRPAGEPIHLADGWVAFDLGLALGKPTRLVNDAALQALGSYRSGRMLFLGLGTGLGSALLVAGDVIQLELCTLWYRPEENLENRLCKAALKSIGREKWQKRVEETCSMLRAAFLPDEIVLGGGNAKFVDPVPPGCRIGDNRSVLLGGELLWEFVTEPPSPPTPKWRVF